MTTTADLRPIDEALLLEAEREGARRRETLVPLPDGPIEESADRLAFVREVSARMIVAAAARGDAIDELKVGAAIDVAAALWDMTEGEG